MSWPMVCDGCGALISNEEAHIAFHRELDKGFRSVADGFRVQFAALKRIAGGS